MKPQLLTLILTLMIINATGQSIANYSSSRSTGITYSSIASTGTSFSSWRNNTGSYEQDDNRSDFTNIGFDFWYRGIRYTQFCVSTNGFIDFSTSTLDGSPSNAAFSYDNTNFTNTNATQPAIAPFYDDLTAQTGTTALGISIKHSVSGTAPNRTLTVEWINMAVYQDVTPNLNFQVQLVETTGQVLINYGSMVTGGHTFSYSMGMNSPTISATPTTAQLKMLQVVNTSVLNNTVQNGLSAMPTANSQYLFTPPVPANPSTTMSFSAVTQTSMTLNWADWATNEVGYVIYNSTDGINYFFASQTAANATSANIAGLQPSTTYFWRVSAVTEGQLSTALTGTQATTAAGNKTSTGTGNWSAAATWTPNGVPTVGDNVTIANGHTVSVNVTGTCNNLTVGQGSSGALLFNNATARTITVGKDITVSAGGTLAAVTTANATHAMSISGNVINNGIINFAPDANSLVNAGFVKNGNQTISGTGTTTFNAINMNMGTSINNILEITTPSFVAASGFLTLTSGTLKMSTTNAVTITPFAAATNMAANNGLYLNSSNVTVNLENSLTLYGKITIANGILNVGNAADEDLISNGGSLALSGGTCNIAGKLNGSGINNLCNYNQSAGTLIVPSIGSTNTTIAPFHVAGSGSECVRTGGLIIIPREGGSGAQDLGFINTGTTGATITGGTLQIGTSTSTAAQIQINADSQIGNLLVNSANVSAVINTNTLGVNKDITIASGTLNASSLDISLRGNWSDAGTFTPGTQAVNFIGTSTQSIFKSGGETFSSVSFSGSGAKTFSSPVTTSANFSVNSGASVDVSASNYSLTVKGNFLNSGTFNTQNGLVTLNGSAAQTIGGSSTTNFYNLTLNNSTGATLHNAENLVNKLTLSNGAFNTNSKVFTLISTANNTGRIAPIVGTGNFTGSLTAQRFAPGGMTGWALLGSPLSSTPTLADWDNEIYISCSTCPDGSAAGFISIYTYSESVAGAYDGAASYIPMNTISDPITPGKGYWVYLGDGQVTTNNITMDLTGTPQKFAVTMPLGYTNHGTPVDDGWNLITNPYPSPISWTSLRASVANVDNAVYVYNTDLNSGVGDFASYVNGVSSPAVGSGGQGDMIAMGQGFYVHVTAAATLTAQETNKVDANPTLLRTANTTSVNQALIRLKLKASASDVDETVLYFEPNAHDYFDKSYDAYKVRSLTPGASLIALELGVADFQINGIAPVNGNFSMPVKALTGATGIFTITAENIGSFPPGACIHLYDNYTSTTTDLRTSDYVVALSDTTTIARFTLNITLNNLSASSTVNQPVCTSPNHGSIVAGGSNAGPWNYYWTSNGTSVKTSLNKNGADTLTNLSGGNFDLTMNTLGMCDHYENSYAIDMQLQPVASFNSADTLYLDLSSSLQFNNTSTNATSSYWDFGTTHDFSNADSSEFSYSSPGFYDVSLIVTSSTGCKDTITKLIDVTAHALGIKGQSIASGGYVLKSLDNNLFLLQADFTKETTYSSSLSDASGNLLANYGTNVGSHLSLNINLDNYSHGVYFLSVISDSGKKVVKLVK